MLKNYLTLAYRNLLKNKVFSLINIVGLAIGVAACLLILRYVFYESSYDTFHPEANRLYRVALQSSLFGEDDGVSVANHPAVGRTVYQEIPQVIDFTRFFPLSIFLETLAVQVKEQKETQTYIEDQMYVADTSFLSLFNFPLLHGDPSLVLKEPNTVVLTEKIAQKYFGTTEVVGRNLYLAGNTEPSMVSGVLADIPENTHLKFDLLLSSASFAFLDNETNAEFNWKWPEYYTYVLLAPEADPSAVEAELPALVDRHMRAITEKYKFSARFFLQPVQDIHLNSHYLKEIKSNNSQMTVSFLLIIGCLIVVVAWVNYVNLSTAKATERAREVGIRKVAGAHSRQLIGQFLTESVIINSLALLLSIIIVQLSWPYFQQLSGRAIDSTFGWWLAPPFSLILIGLLLIGTLLSGLYPAFVLSSFQPLQVLRGKLYHAGASPGKLRISLRQGLIVFQFLVSIMLITGTLGAYQQLHYMRSQSLGFNQEQLLIVKAPSIKDSTFFSRSDALKAEWEQLASVELATLSSEIPGKEIKAPTDFRRANASQEDLQATYVIGVDDKFLQTYDMKLLAGRFFDPNRSADDQHLVLNQKAIEMLGYRTPEEAILQRAYVFLGGRIQGFEGDIIGVIANHHQRSLNNEYDPILLFYQEWRPNYFTLKIKSNNLSNTLDQVESLYANFFPDNPVEHFFLNDFFNQQYQADQLFGQIFSLFALLAIFIACLGLFGLATYTTQHRFKEIGIRKVLGASVSGVIVLLSGSFIKLVMVSSLIAIPLAYLAIQEWLNNYPFRIEVSWWLLLLPVGVVMLIALLTVSLQTIRAALANPVDSLRYE